MSMPETKLLGTRTPVSTAYEKGLHASAVIITAPLPEAIVVLVLSVHKPSRDDHRHVSTQ